MAGVTACFLVLSQLAIAYPLLSTRAAYVTHHHGALLNYELELIELFNRTRPSVVFVSTLSTVFNPFMMNVMEIPSQTGSGFVWDNAGHIVTNFHVLGLPPPNAQSGYKSPEYMVSFLSEDGSREGVKAAVKGFDSNKDVAVLKLQSLPVSQRLKCIELGSSDSLRVGQLALAIGNPFGLDQTLTTGVVSGLGRQVMAPNRKTIYNMIQTDAAVNNSANSLSSFLTVPTIHRSTLEIAVVRCSMPAGNLSE